jgi:peptidoglycan/xylan/chitin deacetylase (PgdA/CDA1 family)
LIIVFSIIIGFCLLVFLYFGLPLAYGRWKRIELKHKALSAGALALTFDDGPGSRVTPLVMQVLAENNAKATFFLLGNNIAGRQSIVKQLAAQGHQICSHGYDHLHHWRISPFRAITDINRGWQTIDSALGANKGTYPFRPPNGRLNIVSLAYLLLRKVPIVYWTCDLGDTWQVRRQNNKKIKLLLTKREGAVVLAHDFDRINRNTIKILIDTLQLTLAEAANLRIPVVTIEQFLELGNTGS